MKKIMIIFVAFLLGCASFFSGCVEEEKQDEIDLGEGTLRLQITDKPPKLDIMRANITISNVQVHKSAADNNEGNDNNGNNDSTENGFIVDAGGDYSGSIGDLIQFEGNASGGVVPYNWSWDFGDGNTSYLQNPDHAYITEGMYEVNLTVTDDTNATDWDIALAVISTDNNGDNDSSAGWYIIVNESQTFDLIALQNVTDILGEEKVTAGKYTQIRLTVENAEITVNNSGDIEAHDLEIPSNTVKLIKAFWIYKNETTVLTLDFDIYKSVHKTGSDRYIMKPTIKVIQE